MNFEEDEKQFEEKYLDSIDQAQEIEKFKFDNFILAQKLQEYEKHSKIVETKNKKEINTLTFENYMLKQSLEECNTPISNFRTDKSKSQRNEQKIKI